jgi:hypothetical protein
LYVLHLDPIRRLFVIPKEHRWDLIDHPGLKVLLPFFRSYLQKGLAEIGSENKTFPASAAEFYAASVLDRVSELDNALGALRITMNFVTDLGREPKPDPQIYRYHYENFVLRVIGFVDRAHRLVGASFLMPRKNVEGSRGNLYVRQKVESEHAQVHFALLAVSEAVDSYKGPRNELIHSTAFTSRELGLLTSVKHFDIDTNGMDIDELARHHFSKGGIEIALTIAQLVKTLKALLEELAPYFESIHQHVQIQAAQ